MEPAAHGKPILVGPSMSNFKDSLALLKKSGACRQVKDEKELASEMLEIVGNDDTQGKNGQSIFAGYQTKTAVLLFAALNI